MADIPSPEKSAVNDDEDDNPGIPSQKHCPRLVIRKQIMPDYYDPAQAVGPTIASLPEIPNADYYIIPSEGSDLQHFSFNTACFCMGHTGRAHCMEKNGKEAHQLCHKLAQCPVEPELLFVVHFGPDYRFHAVAMGPMLDYQGLGMAHQKSVQDFLRSRLIGTRLLSTNGAQCHLRR